MTDEITVGISAHGLPDSGPRFYPMQVGDAIVWIEQVGPAAVVHPAGNEIYAAARIPSPQEIFPQAVDILQECVRAVGDQISKLGAHSRPQEVQIEFALSFEASSEGGFIPVFRAGTGVTAGLKITATWKHDEP
jgi:hypothetical protein